MEDNNLTDQIAAATGAAPSPADKAGAQERQGSLLGLVLNSLDDDKAEEVVTIDLRGKSEIADHMVIASGRSSRQVISIAEKLRDRVKEHTGEAPRMEGKDGGDWVLIDCGDVVCHVFRPEVREFYQLEKMWLPAGTAGTSTG
ncbi:MAG: ribosome silencing factor [Pseudomonadota bacterium]